MLTVREAETKLNHSFQFNFESCLYLKKRRALEDEEAASSLQMPSVEVCNEICEAVVE